MATKVLDPVSRKSELLDAALRYVAEHGIANLSLRPLASAIGTSARLLIFHFHSKDELLAQILEEVQARLRDSLGSIPPRADGQSREAPMMTFWRWASSRKSVPYFRILYEMHFIAIQNPRAHRRYLHRTTVNWLEIIQARLPPSIRNDSIATLCAAVFDGLMMELLGTGDTERTSRALAQFLDMLTAKAKGPA